MSKFFNSKENYTKQLVKNRLRNKRSRKIERARVLKLCQPEAKRLADISALAELLATKLD